MLVGDRWSRSGRGWQRGRTCTGMCGVMLSDVMRLFRCVSHAATFGCALLVLRCVCRSVDIDVRPPAQYAIGSGRTLVAQRTVVVAMAKPAIRLAEKCSGIPS